MPKKSIIERDKKRIKMIKKYADRRAELKAAGDWEALSLLPNNSSPSRRNFRCNLCGRTHGVYRDFGLCRNCFREQASKGNIPGVTKASW